MLLDLTCSYEGSIVVELVGEGRVYNSIEIERLPGDSLAGSSRAAVIVKRQRTDQCAEIVMQRGRLACLQLHAFAKTPNILEPTSRLR